MKQNKLRISESEIIERFKKSHGDNYDYSHLNYRGTRQKVKITCKKCSYVFSMFPNNHANGQGCKKCLYKRLPQNQPTPSEEWIKSAKKLHENSYEYLTPYINEKTLIRIKCKKCGHEFEIQARGHYPMGSKCKKCFIKNNPQNQLKYTIISFEEKCKIIHNNKYKYFQDFRGTNYKMTIGCKKCGATFKQAAYAHLNKKHGCPFCNFSKGELAIQEYLNEHDIQYECQKRFDGLIYKESLRFDFYLPQHNLVIEFDGQLHFEASDYFGGAKYLKETQTKDKIKNKYCKKNNIKLLRISYKVKNKIKEILDEALEAIIQ